MTPEDAEQDERHRKVAIQWIEAALRQLGRYERSLFRIGLEEGSGDGDSFSGFWEMMSEAHFALNALAHARKVARLMNLTTNPPLDKRVRILRDLHEHWEQHQLAFAESTAPKDRAGTEYATMFPGEVSPWRYSYSNQEGTQLGVLDVDEVWIELLRLRLELGAASDFPRPEPPEQLLGVTVLGHGVPGPPGITLHPPLVIAVLDVGPADDVDPPTPA